MAVEHVRHPVIGLQFHPESVLTEHGYLLLDRFLHRTEAGTGEAGEAGGAASRAALPDRADGARAPAPGPAFVAPPVEVVR